MSSKGPTETSSGAAPELRRARGGDRAIDVSEVDADQLRYAALDAEVMPRLHERFVADHIAARPEGHDA